MFKKDNPYLKNTLGTFSIKDIEAVTGIKSHTLRIWEQRYGIIVPKRSETNIRYYDDSDLKTLLNISVLNDNGYKISEIAKMPKDTICEKVVQIGQSCCEFKFHIRSFVSAMMSFDETGFHKLLNTFILQFGLEEAFLKIVFPFLTEVGLLWQVGTILPSHEHFASNIIKQKLYVAIDGQVGKVNPNKKKFLLFLPESEKHSLGLLFANYLIRNRGHELLYLGQEVPLVDLHEAFGNDCPDYILTMMTAAQPDIDKQEYVNYLSANWPNSKIILTGPQFVNAELSLNENTQAIKSLAAFIEFLNAI
ncbi:MAG: MerR family transcriptional regulator [Bacteroidia bacterium]|nr:MerR family transcriptional regulator [Bacteroidia bacterium]MCF8427136.1 MerR family transcriptional regulator [Bacteroidia bacterium]MCF8445781.1 MerR family transcriptional regulator [Bacteroidia bacterium]